jgi:hypothetical protein
MSKLKVKNKEKPTIIKQPLVIMFEHESKILCHLYPRENDTYEHYGLLICDLIRHTAKCFHVNEDNVFEWVEREMNFPTTTIDQVN